MYDKNHYNIVISLQLIKINGKKKRNVVVQQLSHVWLSATPWTAACQASLSSTTSRSLFKFMSIELVMPFNHLILWCPLLLPSISPRIRVLFNEPTFHIRWPNYQSFSISPSNEYSGLISFRTDWFGLLAVQGPLKSLFQHYNLKTSTLWHTYLQMVNK